MTDRFQFEGYQYSPDGYSGLYAVHIIEGDYENPVKITDTKTGEKINSVSLALTAIRFLNVMAAEIESIQKILQAVGDINTLQEEARNGTRRITPFPCTMPCRFCPPDKIGPNDAPNMGQSKTEPLKADPVLNKIFMRLASIERRLPKM